MSDDAVVLVSPMTVYEATDARNVTVKMSVTFDAGNRLTGAILTRDPACLYRHLLFGVGPDGTPDSATRGIPLPDGHEELSAANLSALGFTDLGDVVGVQITAVP